MKTSEDKKKAIDEIVKIIKDFQYNDELSEKYKREILDQDNIYDWQSIYRWKRLGDGCGFVQELDGSLLLIIDLYLVRTLYRTILTLSMTGFSKKVRIDFQKGSNKSNH